MSMTDWLWLAPWVILAKITLKLTKFLCTARIYEYVQLKDIAHLCIFRCIVENAAFYMDYRLSIACGRKIKNYALYFIANKTYFSW